MGVRFPPRASTQNSTAFSKPLSSILVYLHLATALSVNRAYISNIENGRMNPTFSTLEKIAGALGISSSELLK
ncbi:MAG: helix-turn-helix transcriptional regulator [Candidatus Sungiibacteriota bacterium]